MPPGFPPKSNLMEAGDLAKEDNVAITESMESSKKQNDVQDTKDGADEISSCQSPICFSLIADNVDVKSIEPLTGLKKKAMQNEPAHVGVEAVREDATENRARCYDHDMQRNQDSNSDRKNYACEIPNLDLEAWVSRLEWIFAKLKAARFAQKRPV